MTFFVSNVVNDNQVKAEFIYKALFDAEHSNRHNSN